MLKSLYTLTTKYKNKNKNEKKKYVCKDRRCTHCMCKDNQCIYVNTTIFTQKLAKR